MTTNVIDDVSGAAVAWRAAGAPDAPVAVFLHGLGGNRFAWEPQLAALSDVRRCCAWDAPGYGDSPGLIGSLPEAAARAAAWIEELTGHAGTPVDVVGLSFGGMIAQHLALDHPHLVRTLALLDTSPAFGLDGTTTPEDWLATRVTPAADRAADPDRFRGIVEAMVAPGCAPEVVAHVAASMQAIPAPALAAACRALVDHDTRERLARIAAPTLVLVGELDPETPPTYAREIASRIPGARLQTLPGVGHLSNLEAPAAVEEHLRRLWQTPTGDPA